MKDLTDQSGVEEVGQPLARNKAIPSIGEQKIFPTTHQVPCEPGKTPYRSGERILQLWFDPRMDENNVADLKRMAPAGHEHRFTFAAEGNARSWYTGDFEENLFQSPDWLARLGLDQLTTS